MAGDTKRSTRFEGKAVIALGSDGDQVSVSGSNLRLHYHPDPRNEFRRELSGFSQIHVREELLTPATRSRLQAASLRLAFGEDWRSKLAGLAVGGDQPKVED